MRIRYCCSASRVVSTGRRNCVSAGKALKSSMFWFSLTRSINYMGIIKETLRKYRSSHLNHPVAHDKMVQVGGLVLKSKIRCLTICIRSLFAVITTSPGANSFSNCCKQQTLSAKDWKNCISFRFFVRYRANGREVSFLQFATSVFYLH